MINKNIINLTKSDIIITEISNLLKPKTYLI